MSTPLRSVRVRTDVTRVLVVTAHPDDVEFLDYDWTLTDGVK